MRKTIADYCFIFGAAALFFFLSNILLAAGLFLLHGGESVFEEWISIAGTVVFVFVACRQYFKRYFFPSLFLVIALGGVFAGSLTISKRFYDISYDGQTYQQEGVIQLANGWNPVYQNLNPAVIGGDQQWINYYPKGIWIVESYFYLLTHALQTAKGLSLILTVVTGALAYAALIDAEWLGPWEALIVSILISCSPVTIVQSLNFYVDGDLYAVLICLVAIAISLYHKQRPSAPLAFFSAAALLVNIKFTGVVDAGFVLLVLFIMFIKQPNGQLFLKWLTSGIAALAVGILFIGASPYITNTIRYQAPFYPLYGKGSEDLKPYNVPGNFINKNSIEIFFLSFFSRSGDVRGTGTAATYKAPFTYDSAELEAFRYPDPEEGGFGPLFGGILIVTLASWMLCLLLERDRVKQSGGLFWNAGLAIIFLFIMCVINPISSLARYVPQAYLLAIIPVIAFLMLKRPLPATFAYIIITLLCFNGYLIAQSYISYNIKSSDEIRATLSNLAVQSQAQPVLIHFNEFKSNRIMFAEAGISYISVASATDCENFLPENTTQLCNN